MMFNILTKLTTRKFIRKHSSAFELIDKTERWNEKFVASFVSLPCIKVFWFIHIENFICVLVFLCCVDVLQEILWYSRYDVLKG